MLNGSLSEAEEDDVANLLNLDATEEYRDDYFLFETGDVRR